ncbi:MAG TPA: hypothetical protein VGN32_13575, partial [Ktedonobacterales bacterium]|nr:hypothetical protein [Ktedonobacterales bacterium]
MSDSTSLRLSRAEQRGVFDAFARTLRSETHNLADQPDLLWQQTYNRLQWEAEPVPRVLAPELARRSMPGAAPWLRLRTPLAESPALLRTLSGHEGQLTGCTFSPDGALLMSVDGMRNCMLWETRSGQRRLSIVTGLPDAITACAYSPDGLLLLTAGGFKQSVIKLWDAQSGEERCALSGHTGWISACAFSPDGATIASASWDATIKLWDIRTQQERAAWRVPTREVWDCHFSPD